MGSSDGAHCAARRPGEKIAQRTTCAECVEPEGSGNCWLCLLSFCLFLRRLRDVFRRRVESHNSDEKWCFGRVGLRVGLVILKRCLRCVMWAQEGEVKC